MSPEVKADKFKLYKVRFKEVLPLETYSMGPGTSIQMLLFEAIRYCKRTLAGLPVKIVEV